MNTYSTTESARREELELINVARQGNIPARDDLLTSLYEQVGYIARNAWLDYSWALPDLDWQDLVQDACEHLLRNLDKALDKPNPIAYLIGMARTQIRSICYHKTHDSHDNSLPVPRSLDVPLSDDEEKWTLYDVTPAMIPFSPYAHETTDHQDLMNAINDLPDLQRRVVIQHHGIGEQAREEMAEIARPLGMIASRIWQIHEQALGTLYFALGATTTYKSLAHGKMDLLERKRKLDRPLRPLTEQQRQRLDQAYAAIRERGEKVTANGLRQEAHMRYEPVFIYLQERNGKRESRQQQLDEAYARITARGEKVTGKALQQETHVGGIELYLRKRTMEGTHRTDYVRGPRSEHEVNLADFIAEVFHGDQAAFNKAMNHLPPRFYQTFSMRHGLNGYQIHRNCDIARILGEKRSTISNRLQLTMRRLRSYQGRVPRLDPTDGHGPTATTINDILQQDLVAGTC